MENRQLTDTVMMIRPVNFGFNEETASTNPYQHKEGSHKNDLQQEARKEFDSFAKTLVRNKIKVIVFEDTKEPKTPDSIFPNNWVSFHEGGIAVIYPMFAHNRRLERRQDILDDLKKQGYVKKIIDLSGYEKKGLFLEGTGSMVFDRINKIAYSCISPRTDEKMLSIFSKKMGYNIVKFRAKDIKDNDLYHTNIMMSVGEKMAVVCKDAVRDEAGKKRIFRSLEKTGHEIIEITSEECANYAGNLLEMKTADKKNAIIMSRNALKSLRKKTIAGLSKHGKIITSQIDAIENFGGGSARCMLAELF